MCYWKVNSFWSSLISLYSREDSRQRPLFLQHLVDDRSESVMSYYEYLVHLQRQINNWNKDQHIESLVSFVQFIGDCACDGRLQPPHVLLAGFWSLFKTIGLSKLESSRCEDRHSLMARSENELLWWLTVHETLYARACVGIELFLLQYLLMESERLLVVKELQKRTVKLHSLAALGCLCSMWMVL